MKPNFKTVGPIKIRDYAETKGIILQTFVKVLGAQTNGFQRTQQGTVIVLFRLQQQAELTKFMDQFWGKIKKGTYFFDEIDTRRQKLRLLLDIGEPVSIQDTPKEGYQPRIYPNEETLIYVQASNKH